LQFIQELRAEGLSDPEISREIEKVVAIAKILLGDVDPMVVFGNGTGDRPRSLVNPN
jgi:hypothetical protein